jgi:hypothetical protein
VQFLNCRSEDAVVSLQCLKSYKWLGSKLLCVFKFAMRLRSMVSFTFWLLCSQSKNPHVFIGKEAVQAPDLMIKSAILPGIES